MRRERPNTMRPTELITVTTMLSATMMTGSVGSVPIEIASGSAPRAQAIMPRKIATTGRVTMPSIMQSSP